MTVRCSGSDCVWEGFREVGLWQKKTKKWAKWSEMVVFVMNNCVIFSKIFFFACAIYGKGKQVLPAKSVYGTS